MTKKGIIALVVLFLLGLGVGRYSLPAKIVTETKTVQVEAKQVAKEDHTIIVTVKKPDGSVITTTHNDIDTHVVDDKKTDTATTKTVEYSVPKVTISALAASRLLVGAPSMAYGGQIQYRFLGPLQAGVMGLSDGTIGVSLGLTF